MSQHKKTIMKGMDRKTAICLQLIKVVKLKRQFVDVEMKKYGLSRTQWQVMLWLSMLGACSQKELLNNVEIDAAHLTRVLDGLEKKQLIIRSAIEGDKRTSFIAMTALSQQQLMPHIEKVLNEKNYLSFKGLSGSEKDVLLDLLQRLAGNMELALASQTSKEQSVC